MIDVRFYEYESDVPLKFVVIHALMGSQTVWCRHHERTTWELPGGHIEPGEAAGEAAARELREETGATRFSLEPVCVYSVTKDGTETFGALFRAEISAFGRLENEIAEIAISNDPPGEWTYPEIQPKLLAKIEKKSRTASKARSRFLRILAILMVPLLLFAGSLLGYGFGKEQPWIWDNPIVKAIRVWNWHGKRDHAAALARLRLRDPEVFNADLIHCYIDREGFWYFFEDVPEGIDAYSAGSLWYVNRKGAYLLYRGDDIFSLSVHHFKDEHIFRFKAGRDESHYFAFNAGADGPISLDLPDSFVGISGLLSNKNPYALIEPNTADLCLLTIRDGQLCELAAVKMALHQFLTLPSAQDLLDAIAIENPSAEVSDLLWRDNGVITLNLQYDDGRQGHIYIWIEDSVLHTTYSPHGEIVIFEGRATAARNAEEFPVITSSPWSYDKLFVY